MGKKSGNGVFALYQPSAISTVSNNRTVISTMKRGPSFVIVPNNMYIEGGGPLLTSPRLSRLLMGKHQIYVFCPHKRPSVLEGAGCQGSRSWLFWAGAGRMWFGRCLASCVANAVPRVVGCIVLVVGVGTNPLIKKKKG